MVQHLYMGRSPPMFTEMRVLHQPIGDDHLVMELGMNFRTADDMRAILAVKLTKRLGFGMWAKLSLLGMHVEGKQLARELSIASTFAISGGFMSCKVLRLQMGEEPKAANEDRRVD
ncbi:hypothetical protein Vadar_029530 [Vaccinium darrowii]|uniref:Uncharacterized protein n=1 Tax=Vaccinium darrowii TaxID=229202 RepID=A0ACB7ZF94_9ERIC|nr:hypothetical protein Vadar_029530 [Vaccinium darrowii]